MMNITRLFCHKPTPPKSLGEGMRRVVNYVGKGSKRQAAQIIRKEPGLRYYDNGVCIDGWGYDGFMARNVKAESIRSRIDDTLSSVIKFCNASRQIVRNRVINDGNGEKIPSSFGDNWKIKRLFKKDEPYTEVITEFWGKNWKAAQRIYKNDGHGNRQLYREKNVDMPKTKVDYELFHEDYLIET